MQCRCLTGLSIESITFALFTSDLLQALGDYFLPGLMFADDLVSFPMSLKFSSQRCSDCSITAIDGN